jgi:hypothetical protein
MGGIYFALKYDGGIATMYADYKKFSPLFSPLPSNGEGQGEG